MRFVFRQPASELRSKGWMSSDLHSDGDEGQSPFASFGPSYGSNNLVSQSTMLQEKSSQCCRRVKYKTYCPLDDQWIILLTN